MKFQRTHLCFVYEPGQALNTEIILRAATASRNRNGDHSLALAIRARVLLIKAVLCNASRTAYRRKYSMAHIAQHRLRNLCIVANDILLRDERLFEYDLIRIRNFNPFDDNTSPRFPRPWSRGWS